MTKSSGRADDDATNETPTPTVRGDVLPPVTPASAETKAGSNEDLKALHADLTNAYREYLEMVKIKPSMLNPAMLSLIQTFLRHNEITAEAPMQSETHALEKRLEQKRKARERGLASQKIVNLNQANRE